MYSLLVKKTHVLCILATWIISGTAGVVAQQTSQKVVNKDHVIARRMAGERGCGRGLLESRIDQTLLWAWGANSCGQLGMGSTSEKFLPSDQPVPVMLGHTSDAIKKAGGGGGFSFIITESGRVFTTGNNNKGQLGQGYTAENLTVFSHCHYLSGVNIRKVVAGWDFMLGLSDTGSVLSWGSNMFGQLGRALTKGASSDAVPTEVGGSVLGQQIDIAAGLRHGMSLSESGHVYAWGHGKRGQLGSRGSGQGPVAKADHPITVEIPGGEKPVMLLAGMYYSGLLTETGSILVWGCNRYGQCGVDPNISQSVLVPKKVEFTTQNLFSSSPAIVSVASGWTHVTALTASGVLYSWGRADLGQLGRLCEGSCDYSPAPMTGLPAVICHACGSEHTLAVTNNGQVYTWGWNEHSICGTEDEVNVLQPHQISQFLCKKVIGVGCGAGHSFCIVADNIRDGVS